MSIIINDIPQYIDEDRRVTLGDIIRDKISAREKEKNGFFKYEYRYSKEDGKTTCYTQYIINYTRSEIDWHESYDKLTLLEANMVRRIKGETVLDKTWSRDEFLSILDKFDDSMKNKKCKNRDVAFANFIEQLEKDKEEGLER